MANKWSGASVVVSLAILTIVCFSHVSTEMVAGHVYWKQIINKKIKLIYRLQWEGGSEKNNYAGKGTKRQEGDIYVCDSKTSKEIAMLKFQSLDYNPYRKWTLGQGSTKITLKRREFQFYLSEKCMSPFLRVKEPKMSKWSVYISGNLTSPSGSHSPVSYMNPVVPFRPGCYKDIKIPIHDNNHEVQCRWPSLQHGECVPNNDVFSDVLPSCGTPKGVTLDKNCKLKFEGTNKGSHLLTVMIESRNKGHLQSKVPLQFTVNIILTKPSVCKSEPSFDIDERSCVYHVQTGHAFSEETVMEAIRGESLVEVESIMPTGMKLSKQNTVDGFDQHVYELAFRWPGKYVTPGIHLVCFVVTRSDGFMSRQQCFEINVYSGDITNTTVPLVAPTKENNFKMRMDFNWPVKLPSEKGETMVVIAEAHKKLIFPTLGEIMQLVATEQFNKLNKKGYKVYDLAKPNTPILVTDKSSLTLDLHGLLGKGVISKKTRYIVVRYFKNPSSLVKHLPCKNISGLDTFMDVCIFDGKSTACIQPQ